MQSSQKMFGKRFSFMFRGQILLGTWILLIFYAAFGFQVQEQEKWVPDYDQRDEWQQPEKILDAIGVHPGMTVADVGAGKGYFTFRLAERVGPEGKVYANDIDEANLKKIQARIQEQGTKNILTILGQQDDPGLPEGKIDIILMVHVIHIIIHDQDPLSFLENLRPSLKPDGLLIMVHWDGKKMGHPDVYAYSQESLLTVMEKSNFKLVRVETFLPRDNIYIFQVK
jgi:ubiquinone/menaquinone biosynthesis C-methylase UbiE